MQCKELGKMVGLGLDLVHPLLSNHTEVCTWKCLINKPLLAVVYSFTALSLHYFCLSHQEAEPFFLVKASWNVLENLNKETRKVRLCIWLKVPWPAGQTSRCFNPSDPFRACGQGGTFNTSTRWGANQFIVHFGMLLGANVDLWCLRPAVQHF